MSTARTFRWLSGRLRYAVAGAAAMLAMLVVAVPGFAGTGSGGTVAGMDPDCRPKAKLVKGLAVAPDCAPRRVKRVIRGANEIAKGYGYCWGGGHGDWKSDCYDCSGAISYALHKGDLLSRPLDSSGFMSWGDRRKGRWITIFTDPGHIYAVIAGLRFDTSMTAGEGPGWSEEMRSKDGLKIRHKGRF